MQRLFSTFPTGAPGVGLLLFRWALAYLLVTSVPPLSTGSFQSWVVAASVALAALLTLGLFTPLAAGAGAALAFACLAVCEHHQFARDLAQALLMLALALIGAGAYSVDARLYGRRHIIVPRQRER